jgi:methylated-DNA-[protein]-cysteine S-methyltransferase
MLTRFVDLFGYGLLTSRRGMVMPCQYNRDEGLPMLTLLQDKIDTPLGPLWVICDEQFNLRAVEWDQHRDRMEQLLDVHYRREGYQRVDSVIPEG